MVAGWIIGAGGGIGSYERNVNQTAQRGTQGAYTGSKAMGGGAQVLLPVMSFDVSKGHSLKGSKFPHAKIILKMYLIENKGSYLVSITKQVTIWKRAKCY